MTSAPLVSNDLDSQLPGLLAGASVVALVPATDLKGWAAETAWRVARAAALGGRRTALVDCFIDEPTLHAVAGAQNNEGISDAFEYGASLNRIAQQQPQANLFFIPAGTYATDAQPLIANPRWRRLSAGFRHEEALLLLYVAPEHLSTLAADPDGMVVLSPIGLDTTVAEAPALAEALARGLPLLAVVADTDSMRVSGAHHAMREEPGEPAVRERKPAPMQLLVEQNAPGSIPWKALAIALAFLAALIYLIVFLVMKPRPELSSAVPDGAATRTAPAEAPLVGAPPVRANDTLSFAVPVSTAQTLDAAFATLDSLEAAGSHALIAPLRLGGQAPVYRVYRGPFGRSHTGAADTVPLSLPLVSGLTLEGARAERARLRTERVPSFIVGRDTSFALLAGAYRAGTPSAHYRDLLTTTGSAGVLEPRVGYLP